MPPELPCECTTQPTGAQLNRNLESKKEEEDEVMEQYSHGLQLIGLCCFIFFSSELLLWIV